MERFTKYDFDFNGNKVAIVDYTNIRMNTHFDENGRNAEDYYFGKAIDKLAEYENAEEQGLLLRLPMIGAEVYIICTCEEVIPKLDGELYDICGGYGSATGYYCPYENNCPFGDVDGCESVKGKLNVFKDVIVEIQIYENGISLLFEDCKYSHFNELGKTVFFTEAEALQALKERE